jgi:hypothetical protein
MLTNKSTDSFPPPTQKMKFLDKILMQELHGTVSKVEITQPKFHRWIENYDRK